MILEDEIVDLKTEADALVPGIGQYLTGDTVLPDCPSETLRELFAVLSVEQLNKIVSSKNPYFSWFSSAYALFLVNDYQYALAPFVDSDDTITAITPKINKAKSNYTNQHGGRRLTLTTFLSRDTKKKKSYLDRALDSVHTLAVSEKAPNFMFRMSTSNPWKTTAEALQGDVETLPGRKKSISNSSKTNYYTKTTAKGTPEERTVGEIVQTYPGDDRVQKITINDISYIAHGSKAGRKMLYQGIRKMTEAPKDDNGQPVRDYIEIPMKELVDLGVYATIRAARVGFVDGFQVLSMFQIKLHNLKGAVSDIVVQPFITPIIVNNIGYVKIDLNADWKTLLKEYAYFPDYFGRLSSFAQDLLFEIMVLARQNYDAIKKNGFFDVRIRTLQANLNLPNEKKVRNARRDIIERLQGGLNEIEDAEAVRTDQRKKDDDSATPAIAFSLSHMPTLEAHANDYGVDASVSEYLDGRIRVHFGGDILDTLVKLSTNKTKHIDEARKRKAKKKAEEEAKKAESATN